MKDYCPKTCGLCSEVQITGSVVIQGKCEDEDVRCPAWAKYVHYKCPTKFLQDTCPKSCRVCTSQSYKEEIPSHNYEAIIINGGHGSALLTDGNGGVSHSVYAGKISYIRYAFLVLILKKALMCF